MDDPATGETKRVQHRQRGAHHTIYRTNMRTARAAGQWQRIERTKRAMPHLVYRLGHPGASRPACELAGDYPACGSPLVANSHAAEWLGLRLRVRQTSKFEYAKMQDDGGLQVRSPERWHQGG